MNCFHQEENDTIVQVKHKIHIKGASAMDLWGCARDLIVLSKLQVEYPLELDRNIIQEMCVIFIINTVFSEMLGQVEEGKWNPTP